MIEFEVGAGGRRISDFLGHGLRRGTCQDTRTVLRVETRAPAIQQLRDAPESMSPRWFAGACCILDLVCYKYDASLELYLPTANTPRQKISNAHSVGFPTG